MAANGGELTRRLPFGPLLILLALILLGYGLRAHNLDAFSFWTDEGLTPERSGYPVAQILRNEIIIQGFVTRDTHPPLYYLIIHATRQLFGDSDFAFRYPSVLFGVLLVPLLGRLGRRMGGRAVGLAVAALAAVNPLQVYYSQEARMYTLLVLLVTGMSYILWEQIRHTKYEIRNGHASSVSRISYLVSPAVGLVLYSLLAAAALYTHYTAVFVIAAQGVFWVWVLWRRGLRRVILAGAAAAVVVAIPLIPYTLPRLMTGAEANYYAVSPLTMLLDVVRFFHLGLTVDHARPLVIALNVLAFVVAVTGLVGSYGWKEIGRPGEWKTNRRSLSLPLSQSRCLIRPLFLLAWLLAPALGLMLGSLLFKPMYQGVRHIMAGSPAFLLLLAFGIIQIRDTRYEIRKSALPSFVSRISYPVFALVLAGAAYALFNLYANPAYVKDDFRAIVRFIETRAGGDDVVVYNNAVLLPLHDHYRRRPDIAVTALPAYPQPATGREPELAALAADHARVWFVTDPPADGRDDDQLIRRWLDDNLIELIDRNFPARTTVARVLAYQGRRGEGAKGSGGERELACAPASLHPCTLSPNLPALAGVAFNSPVALPTLWIDLVWQGERPRANDTLLFALAGPDGRAYVREGRAILPGVHQDEPGRWDATAPVRLSYDVPLPPGLPPGPYALTVGDGTADPLSLGTVEIAPTTAWPVAPEVLFPEVPSGQCSVFSNQCALFSGQSPSLVLSVHPWDTAVRPGNTLPVTLYWRVGAGGVDLSDIRYRLEVVGGDGSVLRSQEDRPGAPWLGRVPAGALLREETGLYIQPNSQPGNFRLRWTLLQGDTAVASPQHAGRITVEPWPLNTDVPAAPYIVEAEFGPAIRLHSYNMGVPTDGLLSIDLYWQTRSRPERDYMVFIHLVNEAGEIVSQIDAVPAGGTRPTSGWRPREVISDFHNLPIPADLPPGLYVVNVGLYDPDDFSRPAVTVDGTPQPDNQLRLDSTLVLPWSAP